MCDEFSPVPTMVLRLPALSRGSGYRHKRFDVGNGDVRAAFARHKLYTRVELLCQGVDDAGSQADFSLPSVAPCR